MVRVGYENGGTFSFGFLVVNDGPLPVKVQGMQVTGQSDLLVTAGLETAAKRYAGGLAQGDPPSTSSFPSRWPGAIAGGWWFARASGRSLRGGRPRDVHAVQGDLQRPRVDEARVGPAPQGRRGGIASRLRVSVAGRLTTTIPLRSPHAQVQQGALLEVIEPPHPGRENRGGGSRASRGCPWRHRAQAKPVRLRPGRTSGPGGSRRAARGASERAGAAEAQVLDVRSEAETLKTQLAEQAEQLRALGAEAAELVDGRRSPGARGGDGGRGAPAARADRRRTPVGDRPARPEDASNSGARPPEAGRTCTKSHSEPRRSGAARSRSSGRS